MLNANLKKLYFLKFVFNFRKEFSPKSKGSGEDYDKHHANYYHFQGNTLSGRRYSIKKRKARRESECEWENADGLTHESRGFSLGNFSLFDFDFHQWYNHSNKYNR